MKLADKNCYPINENTTIGLMGLTFRERLVIALAGNPAMIQKKDDASKEKFFYLENGINASRIILQADAIISKLEKE